MATRLALLLNSSQPVLLARQASKSGLRAQEWAHSHNASKKKSRIQKGTLGSDRCRGCSLRQNNRCSFLYLRFAAVNEDMTSFQSRVRHLPPDWEPNPSNISAERGGTDEMQMFSAAINESSVGQVYSQRKDVNVT
ncbi:hypothetical protein Plhal304r1_c008g0031781 [Plasmopara halstedii]